MGTKKLITDILNQIKIVMYLLQKAEKIMPAEPVKKEDYGNKGDVLNGRKRNNGRLRS